MRYVHFHPITGHGYNFLVRNGFADFDVWGGGLIAATYAGPLDAPDIPPSGGSTALHIAGSIAGQEQRKDFVTTHACRQRFCVCGGRGDTVHVRNA